MKKIFFFILFCYFVNPIFSQEESQTAKFSTLPSVDIKTLDGKNFNTKILIMRETDNHKFKGNVCRPILKINGNCRTI